MTDHLQILQFGQKVQFAVTVSLNQQKIKKDPQRTTKIKSIINKNNQDEINFPSENQIEENLRKVM